MDIAQRPVALDPYEGFDIPVFTLKSDDLVDGQAMPDRHAGIEENLSPHLSWHGFPEQTQSFFLTCFDPDAPVPAGWWHWGIVDLDANCTQLPTAAGTSDLELDGAAFHLKADHGDSSYFGAAPPPGDRPHRYIFAVHALDVPTLGLDDESTITNASFQALEHTIARATLTVTYQR